MNQAGGCGVCKVRGLSFSPWATSGRTDGQVNMMLHICGPRGGQLTWIGVNWLSCMMTSSNGNIFRVTGPLCGEFTGPGEFPAQRPVTRSFDVFFDLSLNKRVSKQPWGWWFETPPWSLWRQCNGLLGYGVGSEQDGQTDGWTETISKSPPSPSERRGTIKWRVDTTSRLRTII